MPALTSGAQLGPYRISGKIGAGGMGEVYRASDSRLGREVAVKVLPAEFSADPERLRRFEREARAVGALNHPGLLTIHDVGSHNGAPYLVSELLEGETLRARLGRGALAVGKALEFAAQIANGLAAAHEKGIVHRDLKPENLFVCKDGRVKILDFGLAKLTRPEAGPEGATTTTLTLETESGVLFGTVGYMSPEQVRGEPADHRSDLFAFGAVLYEMLSGQRAFQGGSSIETLNAILNQEPPGLSVLAPKIPAALELIVRHCLEKSPHQRFQSAIDVAFDLETVALAPEARPSTGRRQAKRWQLAAAAVMAVFAIVGVGSLLRARQASHRRPASFRRLTFQRGIVGAARFAPDGQTIVYSAAWNGRPSELFATRIEGAESRPLGLGPATLYSISSKDEMAITLRPIAAYSSGTLARASLAGGAPREILEGVEWADWSPDGARLAVVRNVDGKRRLEFPIGKVLFETTTGIGCPRIAPAGDRIAFLDQDTYGDGRGSVAVIGLDGTRRTLSSKWEDEWGLAWTPSGDEIWFTAAASGSGRALHAVTLSGRERVVANVPGRLTLQDIYRDGRVLLTFETFAYEVKGVDRDSSQERNLSWLDWSLIPDLSADGKTLLLTENSEGAGRRYAVGIRGTDGSPVVRLGEGSGAALSPDGKWALAVLPTKPSQLALYPTGFGESKLIPLAGFENYSMYATKWFPDGKRIAFVANRPGEGARVFEQNPAGGEPHPITPEGIGQEILYISPDGLVLLCRTAAGWMLYPEAGGTPRPLPGIREGEYPIRFASDGRSVFVNSYLAMPAKIYRIDLSTGQRQFWRAIGPTDPAGVSAVNLPVMSGDGMTLVYLYGRTLSTLYVAEGLR
jgi:Tol biopolymer transport system component